MPQTNNVNRRIVLAQRPDGLPDKNTLRLEESAVPEVKKGEMLLRTRFLSLDPYMRGRMNDAKSYATPVAIGEVMTGGAITEVVASNLDGFEAGDNVVSRSGWQDYAVSDGTDATNLGKSLSNPTWYLGVAAASGPVGATVGQIAKLKGCHVVGIAGGREKCAHVVDNLGFDHCIDHKSDDLAEQLASCCPDGIDVYFENVGGKVLYAVLPLLNPFARIPVCGVVSWYNLTGLPDGPDYSPAIMGTILRMKVKMQGFIIFDSFTQDTHREFIRDMNAWLESGKIVYKEQLIDGLENAPAALNDASKLILYTSL